MRDWSAQKFLIIGAARQGVALARYLASNGADVILTDMRNEDQLQAERQRLADLKITWILGGHPLHLLDGVDWVCPSGGVPLTAPLIIESRRRGIPLTNDSQIFLEVAPCKVIGITGSAGKTTTTTLVGHMIEAAIGAERTWVGGNIGNPLISEINEIAPDHIAVMELSSFQLEIMTKSPDIAAILNITPNHLDRHITMDAYTRAKAQIIHHQNSEGIAVLGCDDPGAWALADQVRGSLVTFENCQTPQNYPGSFLDGEMISFWDGKSVQNICPRDQILLRGEHNLKNILAAAAIVSAVGLFQGIQAGIEGFNGVEHRLEFVGIHAGAKWYNDSIATAPERAMAAVRSFDEPLVLLAGGRDKDLPWDDFGDLIRQRVDHLIVFGEAKEVIMQSLGQIPPDSRPFSVDCCAGLQEAVNIAYQVAREGDVVLFSPGGTSFDEFRDFAERGEWFRKWLKKLA